MTASKILAIAITGWLLLGPIPANAGKQESGFLERVHKGADGKDVKYVLFVPHDYKGDRLYPLILFLHGAGEWGTDGQKQVSVGLGPAVKKRRRPSWAQRAFF